MFPALLRLQQRFCARASLLRCLRVRRPRRCHQNGLLVGRVAAGKAEKQTGDAPQMGSFAGELLKQLNAKQVRPGDPAPAERRARHTSS